MFDYVDFKCSCPTCGEEVTGFQSKDGVCLLETVKPWQVCKFYSYCKRCGTRIEYNRTDEAPVLNELLVEAITLLSTMPKSPEVNSFLEKTGKYISKDQSWLDGFERTVETKAQAEERWKKS